MPVSFKMKILAERLMWSLSRKCFKKKQKVFVVHLKSP